MYSALERFVYLNMLFVETDYYKVLKSLSQVTLNMTDLTKLKDFDLIKQKEF